MDVKDIKKLEDNMKINKYIELDKEQAREDYFGSIGDIAQTLNNVGPQNVSDFYEYISLYDKEQQMYSPVDAFKAGQEAYKTNADCDDAFFDYIKSVFVIIDNSDDAKRRHTLFHGLCEALGDNRWMMDEFNDLYKMCNSFVSTNLFDFFTKGYNAADENNK